MNYALTGLVSPCRLALMEYRLAMRFILVAINLDREQSMTARPCMEETLTCWRGADDLLYLIDL